MMTFEQAYAAMYRQLHEDKRRFAEAKRSTHALDYVLHTVPAPGSGSADEQTDDRAGVPFV